MNGDDLQTPTTGRVKMMMSEGGDEGDERSTVVYTNHIIGQPDHLICSVIFGLFRLGYLYNVNSGYVTLVQFILTFR